MKKLLSLLNVLTISGTSIPTVIAANPYKIKENKLENSEIKFKENNNLKRRWEWPWSSGTKNILANNTYYINIKNNEFKATLLQNSKIKNTVLSIATNSSAGSYFATLDGVYYTKNNESTLNSTKISGIDEPIAQIAVAPSNSIYFVSISGNAYYLGSDSWTAVNINNYYNVPEIKNVLSIAITSGNAVYYSTAEGIYYMKNNSWTAYKINGIDEPIAQIAVAPSNSIYFVSISGNAYYLGSDSWTAVNINNYYNVPEIKNVLSIAITSGNAVYYSTAEGIYYMKNNSWTAYKINGIDEPIAQIEINKDNNVYFLGISGNVYYLYHNWWTAVNINNYYNVPEIKNVLSIAITSNNSVYYGTANGVYYMSDTIWTANKIDGIDGTIMLIQAYTDNTVHVVKSLNKNISAKFNLQRRWSWPWSSGTDNEILIDVPEIRQQTQTWCGPAVAEAVLRTFNWNNDANIHNNNNLQQELANDMRTNDNIGTSVENLASVINNFFQTHWDHDLNIDIDVSPPQYSLTRILATERRMGFSTAEEVNFIQTINNIISTSLKAGVPVIIRYSGNLPSNHRCEDDDYHYILINGISESTTDIFETRYSYMDPQRLNLDGTNWTGSLRNDLRARDFDRLFWGGNNIATGEELYQDSHLLSYIPPDNIQDETNFPYTDYLKNTLSTMGTFGLCHYHYNSKLNNRNKRSVDNNKISTCLPIDKNNPYYDKENDYFKIKLHDFGHNGIEVKLSLKTAQVIEKIYFEKDEIEFKEYLNSLFKKINFYNEGYTTSNTDYEYPADILYWGFVFFHKETINLIRNGNPESKSIFIETRRKYNWNDLDYNQRKQVIYSSKDSKCVFD